MKYSEDKKVYTFIVEDANDLTTWTYGLYYDDTVEDIDLCSFKFTGTLQEFGSFLSNGDFLQTDIKKSIQRFEKDLKNDNRQGENRIPGRKVVLGQLCGRKYDSICYYIDEQ